MLVFGLIISDCIIVKSLLFFMDKQNIFDKPIMPESWTTISAKKNCLYMLSECRKSTKGLLYRENC